MVILAIGVALLAFETTYAERVYPGVNANGVQLGGFTRDEARIVLEAHFRQQEARVVVLRYRPSGEQPREWKVRNEELGLHGQVSDTVDAAYSFGREGSQTDRLGLQLEALRGDGEVSLSIDEDASRRTAFVARVAREINRPPAEARLVLASNGQVRVQAALSGRELDVARARAILDRALDGWAEPDAHEPAATVLDLPVTETTPAVVESDLAPLVDQATRMVAPLTLVAGGETLALDRAQIHSLLQVKAASQLVGGRRFELSIDEVKLKRVIEGLARKVDREPRNARLDFLVDELTAIAPPTDGQKLDQAAALVQVRGAFEREVRTLELPVATIQAGVSSASAVAPAIRELVDRTTTSYAGGSAERRYNVELAAQRLNGVVVPPGGTFSFNDEVGEVSYRSGYKRGWGISRDDNGGVVTIPSEGGGICQVATTIFQAAFWSGYQIVERSWHSYWIPRYGLPPKGMKGLDATIDQVYDKDGLLVSETDLRFKNNTESPILIQTRFDGKNLTVSLFGTKPDWQVKVNPPKIEKVVKADQSPVRQTDSSLAPGTELQIESAQDGFQATIVRTISRGGKVLEQRSFVSTYRPSRNVFVSGPKAGAQAN